jgi:hypothetical protein
MMLCEFLGFHCGVNVSILENEMTTLSQNIR